MSWRLGPLGEGPGPADEESLPRSSMMVGVEMGAEEEVDPVAAVAVDAAVARTDPPLDCVRCERGGSALIVEMACRSPLNVEPKI